MSLHPEPSARRERSTWRLLALYGCAALAAVLAYQNTFSAPFFFDDDASIAENPTIHHLTDLRAVLGTPIGGTGAAGRPMVNLSLAINYALGGTAVAGYHAFNLGVHLLAGLTLAGVIRRTLLAPALETRYGAGASAIAVATAFFWMLHPLQTESVTCVIQRTELLVGVFYLGTLYASIRAMQAPQSRRWPALAIGSCALGMLSKEVMVSAPLLVLLYDRAFFAGSLAAAWRARRALYTGLAATWLILGVMLVRMGGTRGDAAGLGVGVEWWMYALKQCEAIVLYLKLTFWPHPLIVDYGADLVLQIGEVWWQAALLLLLAGFTAYATWRRPVVGFVGLWFFAILSPSSSVVPLVTQTIAEHRMYLPLAAPLVLAIAIAYRLTSARALVGIASAATVALGLTTFQRNANYATQIDIWTDTVAKQPDNPRARLNLGVALQQAERYGAALEQLQTAVRLQPKLAATHNAMASLLLAMGRPADAISAAETALQLQPGLAHAHHNLGNALAHLGRTDEARRHLLIAARLLPNAAAIHSNLARVTNSLGRHDEARNHALEALRLSPGFADAETQLGVALVNLGQPAEAIPHFAAVVQKTPQRWEGHQGLGNALFQLGRFEEAQAHFAAAVLLQPDHANIRNNFASALLQAGRLAEAVEQYRLALELAPERIDTRCNLALALGRAGRIQEAVAEINAALRADPDNATARSIRDLLPVAPSSITP